MKKKIKLIDMTQEQYTKLISSEKQKGNYCYKNSCDDCPFSNVVCGYHNNDCWVAHKDLYSDKFLGQEVEIDVPEILTKEEHDYLSAVIKPWGATIISISKCKTKFANEEFIYIQVYNNPSILFPRFGLGTMYKGMEIDKHYTLEELGL